MNQIQRAVQSLAFSTIVLALATTTQVSATYAETYIAGQFGVTLPSVAGKGLGEGDLTGVFAPGSTISAQSLEKSILYGAKVGHYFKAVPWLGLEAEVYNTTPHIKQQVATFTGPSGSSGSIELPGLHLRVLTFAPLNVMFRYHKTRLQPYVGVGPGLFFARIEDPALTSNNTQSSMGFGVNAQAGVRYYITRQVALFGEGKFNYTRFSFDETPAGIFNLFGFDADYKMFHASFGLSVHF
ncbi:MAG: porin family protein [Nitrospira sp.]|nr:porin family protein [Nitrospira sp.]